MIQYKPALSAVALLALAACHAPPAPGVDAQGNPDVPAPAATPVAPPVAKTRPSAAERKAAADSTARCVVHSASNSYDGPCKFTLGSGGSFVIDTDGGFVDGTHPISVSIVRPDVADVRGVTSNGVNSRWGEAKRSTDDPACWLGADFSVCAY